MQAEDVRDDVSEAPSFILEARMHLDHGDLDQGDESLSEFSLIAHPNEGQAVRTLRKEVEYLAAQTAADAAARTRREWRAALSIECSWRRRCGRSRWKIVQAAREAAMDAVKARSARQLPAAVVIQAAARRAGCRERLRQALAAVRALQAAARCRQTARRHQQERAAAAARIQTSYREYAVAVVHNPHVSKTRLKSHMLSAQVTAKRAKSQRRRPLLLALLGLAMGLALLLGASALRHAELRAEFNSKMEATRLGRQLEMARKTVQQREEETEARIREHLEAMSVLECENSALLQREAAVQEREAALQEREKRLQALQRDLADRQRRMERDSTDKDRPATHAFPESSDYFGGYRGFRDYVNRRMKAGP